MADLRNASSNHAKQAGVPWQEILEVQQRLLDAMRANGPDRVAVAFKAMHEGVDSFGALPYAAPPVDG